MRRLARSLLLAAAALLLPARVIAAEEVAVDLELVIAVDVSRSMDAVEGALQREGYAQGLQHPTVLDAIAQSGAHGRIAVAYVEWAGSHYQKTVADWMIVDGPSAADRFAELIRRAPYMHEFRTSISQALAYSAAMFEENGYSGLRRVIDVSGDGANNMGTPVIEARQAVLERGITINGLPIMTGRQNPYGWFTIEHLDRYFADCVIGGPGAFIIPIRERDGFAEAIRRKLLLEIAGRSPVRRTLVHRVQSASDCLIGERQWQRFMRDRQWFE